MTGDSKASLDSKDTYENSSGSGYQLGDPATLDQGIFGLGSGLADAALVLLNVPWDATSSYGRRSHLGPKAILEASGQLDHEIAFMQAKLDRGVFLLPEDQKIHDLNVKASKAADSFRASFYKDSAYAGQVNEASYVLNNYLADQIQEIQAGNEKRPSLGMLGGDHSCPFSLIQGVAKQQKKLDILHIDAHFDLRPAYEGFTHSHASIMHNVLENIPEVQSITSLGVRDYCRQEWEQAQDDPRIRAFTAHDVFSRIYRGENFHSICEEILDGIKNPLYISFDIDGLDASLCPGTGTPVPGGLQFQHVAFLFEQLVQKQVSVAGFDLCEVAPSDFGQIDAASPLAQFDGNVGARIAMMMAALVLQ